MREIIAQLNITPDGFCGHADVIADDELHEFATKTITNAGTGLFGRVTFQLMESYWPAAAKDATLPEAMVEFAHAIDNIDKIVFSKTLETVEWKNTTILNEINFDTIMEMKRNAKKDIITGGPGVISQLSKLGLIDKYYFLVHPIMAGKGKRLFETINLDNSQNLKLADTKFFKSGVVVLCYRVVR